MIKPEKRASWRLSCERTRKRMQNFKEWEPEQWQQFNGNWTALLKKRWAETEPKDFLCSLSAFLSMQSCTEATQKAICQAQSAGAGETWLASVTNKNFSQINVGMGIQFYGILCHCLAGRDTGWNHVRENQNKRNTVNRHKCYLFLSKTRHQSINHLVQHLHKPEGIITLK